MAKAPGKAKDFDGAGNVWFKIHEITAYPDTTGKNTPYYPSTSESWLAFHSLIIILRSNDTHPFHHPKESPQRRVSIALRCS